MDVLRHTQEKVVSLVQKDYCTLYIFMLTVIYFALTKPQIWIVNKHVNQHVK